MSIHKSTREGIAVRREPIIADEYAGPLSMSASRPQKYGTNGDYWAVKYKSNGYGNGRALVAEHLVGLAGGAIGAAVPDVRLMLIDMAFIPVQIDMNGAPHPSPGLHHASYFHVGYGDRGGLAYIDENRPALAKLAILYAWLHCFDDHQLIYQVAPPHRVLSVDHSCFLPKYIYWDEASLAADTTVTPDNFFLPAGLSPAEMSLAVRPLKRIGAGHLGRIVGSAPPEWGITARERLALFRFLDLRRRRLIEMYDLAPGGP